MGIVDELMVKCGRRCCICRRFKPQHLHVHHIVERSEGGDDSPDNLIPICLTCHSDVHARTALTRRFTINELKGHRESLFRAVEDGLLVEGEAVNDSDTALVGDIISAARGFVAASAMSADELSPNALELLLKIVQSDGMFYDLSENFSNSTTVDDVREMARLKTQREELEELGLLAFVSGILYHVTDTGFLLTDQVLAAGSSLRGDDEDSRRVRQQLQDKQSFEFDGIALANVIQYISKVAGVNIHVKWAFLNAAGVSEDSEVNVKLLEVTIEKALRVVLEDVAGVNPLGFYIDDGVITISTRSGLDQS